MASTVLVLVGVPALRLNPVLELQMLKQVGAPRIAGISTTKEAYLSLLVVEERQLCGLSASSLNFIRGLVPAIATASMVLLTASIS